MNTIDTVLHFPKDQPGLENAIIFHNVIATPEDGGTRDLSREAKLVDERLRGYTNPLVAEPLTSIEPFTLRMPTGSAALLLKASEGTILNTNESIIGERRYLLEDMLRRMSGDKPYSLALEELRVICEALWSEQSRNYSIVGVGHSATSLVSVWGMRFHGNRNQTDNVDSGDVYVRQQKGFFSITHKKRDLIEGKGYAAYSPTFTPAVPLALITYNDPADPFKLLEDIENADPTGRVLESKVWAYAKASEAANIGNPLKGALPIGVVYQTKEF
jgi:hypothetical protein